MFELLPSNTMEHSLPARQSLPNLSPPPGLLPVPPAASSPAAFSPMIKSEPDDSVRCESPTKQPPRSESPFNPLVDVASIKVEAGQDGSRQDVYDDMLKRRLEMYWNGILKFQQQKSTQAAESPTQKAHTPPASEMTEDSNPIDVYEKARSVVQRMVEGDNKMKPTDGQMPWPSLTAMAASRQLRSPRNDRNSHISNRSPTHPTQDNLQQASILSQQALAAMLSLHSIHKPSQNDLGGDLLPPPPVLWRQGANNSSQVTNTPLPTSSAEQSYDYGACHRHPSTSYQMAALPLNLSHNTDTVARTYDLPTSTSINEATDGPLDLSMSVSGRKRIRDSPPKIVPKPPQPNGKVGRPPPPLLCVGQAKSKINDPQSLANIQSNFPSILNKSGNRVTQQALLEAHIKNSLANKPVSAANGPFMSLYQSQDVNNNLLQNALAAAGGKTLNELVQGGVPPIQIQQWLLAAMSAQKAQQVALNQFTLLQQQQQNQNIEPPKKRSKMNTPAQPSPRQPLHSFLRQQQKNSMLPQITNSQAPAAVNSFTKVQSNHFNPTSNNRSPKSSSSPNLSPDSAQNQSGKRYRRYAKPPYSYVSLITLSILSSRDKKLRLSQILKRISEMFPFFNGSYQGWRDSVRHNLSQNECFVKVLKNPYRPTAKGNFWTVNLNSIPHELLLRQNTLVSRYAQDSGYRYRKDLSEVFDLRTGAIKVPVPRHLFRDVGDIQTAALSEDPAAVMEATLLEETNEDEMNDYKDKILPEMRRFTLEDLFNQGEDGDDDLSMTGGRGRRAKQATHDSSTRAAASMPPPYASLCQTKNPFFATNQSPTMVDNLQVSLHNRAMEAQRNMGMRMMAQPMLPGKVLQNSEGEMPLSGTTVPNPFAAAQTALLSKALATQLQGLSTFPAFQKIFYANQLAAKQRFDASADYSNISSGSKTPSPPPNQIQPASPSGCRNTPSPVGSRPDEHNQTASTDPPSSQKKNKRKGVQPVRRTGSQEEDGTSHADDSMTSSSPHRSSFSTLPGGVSDVSSRTLSSEVESATAVCNPFPSPMVSLSTKSHTSVSPHHDDSSEYDDHSLFNMGSRSPAGLSDFQRMQLFGVQSLQAGKMM